jgi:hypothetical protein
METWRETKRRKKKTLIKKGDNLRKRERMDRKARGKKGENTKTQMSETKKA